MNWFELCSYLFLGLLMTAFTGSIFTVLWLLLRKCLSAGYMRLTDICLRICIQTYMIPVLFLVLLAQHRDNFMQFGMNGLVTDRLFVFSPSMKLGMVILVLIWLAAFAASVGYWLIQLAKMKRSLAGAVQEEDEEVLDCYRRIKQQLGIRRRIPLMRNDLFAVPFTVGVLRQRVVLPFTPYTERELEVIFAHELSHCKRYDLLFKIESIFMNVLYAVNPFSYLIRHYITEHTEMTCDICACESAKGLFSVKEYYSVVLELSSGGGEKPRALLSALFDKTSQLEKRVRMMKEYQKRGAVKKSVSRALLAAFVTSGLLIAYAAGNQFVSLQSDLYEATRELENESGTDEITEYVTPAEQVDHSNTVVMEEGINGCYEGTYLIDWNVPKGTKWETKPFALSEGTAVGISFENLTEQASLYVGLEYPDGTEHYVEGEEIVAHTFLVPMTGEYRFFIVNAGDKTARMEGGITY